MPPTPSRALRDQAVEDASREAGRAANESKFTEFQMGCDAGSPHACTSLGEWWSTMRGDFVKASELYTDACLEKRYSQACLNLGMILAAGRPGVAPSHPQAIEVLSIGCAAGNADACSEAGKLVLKGAARASVTAAATAAAAATPTSGSAAAAAAAPPPPSLLPAAVARADSLFATGCEVPSGTASNARCCGLRASLHLSSSFSPHLPPRGGPDYAAQLLRWLELGCAGEHGASCMALASAYRGAPGAATAALGLPKDVARANALEVKGLEWMGLTPSAAARAVEKKHGSSR